MVAERSVHEFLVVVPVEPSGVEPAAEQHFERFLFFGRRFYPVESPAVGVCDRRHVFRALEAAFHLQRVHADFFELFKPREGAQVARAEQVLRRCIAVFLAVNEDAVGEPATLGALPAVRAAAAEVFAGEALPRIAHAERPVNEHFEFERSRALDGRNLLYRKFAGEHRAVEPDGFYQVHGLSACKRHLRARMNFLLGRDGANQARKPDILDDERIRFQRYDFFQKFRQFLQFALEYEHVHREERAHSAEPCVADHVVDIVERKVFRSTARVPVRNPEINGIGPVVDCRFEHFARAYGQE